MNYYRRYVGDYLRDTARLSLLEHGVYSTLLDYYYADETPTPLDLDEVYRMVRATTPEERRAVIKVLTKFFDKREDGYHNKRADKEIETSRKARENGSKGGRPATGTGTEEGTGDGTEPKTEPRTGHGGGSVHPPTTTHQPPPSDPPSATSQPPVAAAERGQNVSSADRTRKTRQAYVTAYERRWEVEPVLDRQANSMIKKFVEKLGVEEAPAVAAFYLTHNRQDYVRSKHDVALMLRDARGLRTEWATGRKVTDTAARQADKSSANADMVNDLLREVSGGRRH